MKALTALIPTQMAIASISLLAQSPIPYHVFTAPVGGPIVIIINPKNNNYNNIKQLGYEFKKMYSGQSIAVQIFDDLRAAQTEHQVLDSPILLEDNSKKTKARLALEKHYGQHFLGTIVLNSSTKHYSIDYYPKGTYTKRQDDTPESHSITLN